MSRGNSNSPSSVFVCAKASNMACQECVFPGANPFEEAMYGSHRWAKVLFIFAPLAVPTRMYSPLEISIDELSGVSRDIVEGSSMLEFH